MSKVHVDATDTGSWNRKIAFGMLKKSGMAMSVMAYLARPAPSSIETVSGGMATVQNSPSGYGKIPGSKSWTWVLNSAKSN